MGLFSEELRMLDRNTVQLMIDDMQKTIDSQGEQLIQWEKELSLKNTQLTETAAQLQEALKRIAELENK